MFIPFRTGAVLGSALTYLRKRSKRSTTSSDSLPPNPSDCGSPTLKSRQEPGEEETPITQSSRSETSVDLTEEQKYNG